ncbi:MAG: hypothetical protein A2X36_13860 [Elusimicrobia bacterium GWA2_69_24]|nr:MAG: hypothetical protein A2X36_13860 [Elusimicrobia bacterium GWA2_69_24]HBL16716.1 hypothetical protein [Elusimicrobiota bacterium]
MASAPEFRILETGDVFLTAPDCRLSCEFCSHGAEKRLGLGRSPAPPDPARVLAGLERVLDRSRSGPVRLAGWDILEFDGLFKLLDACRRRGRPVELVTPGLRLAESGFARRLAAYHPTVVVSCLARDPAIYARMTGLPDAQRLVDRAIANLRRLKLRFSVNFVVTRTNCAELLPVAGYLLEECGLGGFMAAFYSPDEGHSVLGAAAGELLVSFRRLNAELKRFAARYRTRGKRLDLCRIPPCKVSPGVRRSGCVVFRRKDVADPVFREWRHPACAACSWDADCFHVSARYHERFPRETFPAASVDKTRLHYT